MTTIIKNGEIVGAKKTITGDIKIENGRITKIGEINDPADKVIDATGKLVLPGGIDVHTHLDLDTGTTSTADDFATGTKAAIAGGTTTIIDFATQSKGGTLREAVEEWQTKAAKGTFCDYGFHMAIVDWNDEIKSEMQDMVKAGIPSFKLYMAYKGSLQVDDSVIFEALDRSKEIGGIIGFHCENGDIISEMIGKLKSENKKTPYYHPKSRPDTVEAEAIFRLSTIAEITGAPIWVVHLSTEKGLKIIEEMKSRGVEIITETCPQYLLLDESLYGTENDPSFEGAKYVISPPLRKQPDIDAMWQGLKQGEIDFVSTDHCSFNFKNQKELGKNDFSQIPNGGPGLEHRMILLYNFGVDQNRLTVNKMVDLLCEAPSKLFGLENKGEIAVGKDADIVIIDPKGKTLIKAETQYQNLDYTPYEGFELNGKIETVFLRGEEIFSDNQLVEEAPKGIFQKRSPYKSTS